MTCLYVLTCQTYAIYNMHIKKIILIINSINNIDSIYNSVILNDRSKNINIKL